MICSTFLFSRSQFEREWSNCLRILFADFGTKVQSYYDLTKLFPMKMKKGWKRRLRDRFWWFFSFPCLIDFDLDFVRFLPRQRHWIKWQQGHDMAVGTGPCHMVVGFSISSLFLHRWRTYVLFRSGLHYFFRHEVPPHIIWALQTFRQKSDSKTCRILCLLEENP